jgi:hypothetical protein
VKKWHKFKVHLDLTDQQLELGSFLDHMSKLGPLAMLYSIGPPGHIMVRMSWFHQHVDNLCLSGWIPLWPTMSKKKNFNIFYSFHIGSKWPEYSTTSWLATEDINNSRTIMVGTYLCKHDNRAITQLQMFLSVSVMFLHLSTVLNFWMVFLMSWTYAHIPSKDFFINVEQLKIGLL